MAGEKFDLAKNEEILKINSPKSSVGGPYAVVYKHMEERWVIVALDWDGEPRLGIRWFWEKSGNPISTGYPTWFILPTSLTNTILNGLPLSHATLSKVNKYLSGDMSGSEF